MPNLLVKYPAKFSRSQIIDFDKVAPPAPGKSIIDSDEYPFSDSSEELEAHCDDEPEEPEERESGAARRKRKTFISLVESDDDEDDDPIRKALENRRKRLKPSSSDRFA